MARTSMLLAFLLLGGCGTSAELSRDDHARDDRALSSRADHDEVVRLSGDLEGPAAEGAACESACLRNERVQDLSERICSVARNDDHDEATQFLCEDALERARSTERRAADCSCPTAS